MDDANANNTFYLVYANARPCWPLVVSAAAFGLVALCGMAMNFGVVFVTAKSKSLRGTANFLLALSSCFELAHQSGHFLFVYTAFSGTNFVPYRQAVHICTLSLFGLFGLNLSMLFTGLDRFICVALPTRYKSMRSVPYLTAITVFCVSVCAFLVSLFYDTANQMPSLQITGTLGDLLKGNAGSFYTKYALGSNALTIAVYTATGLILHNKSAVDSSVGADSVNRRIFRSLLTIVCVNIGGYFVVAVYLVFVAPQMAPVPMWFVRTFLGVLFLNMSAASNGPILYFTSTDYRKAFRQELACIFCGQSSSVQPTGTIIREWPNSRSKPVTGQNNI